MQGLAGQAFSQKVKVVNQELAPQTQAPFGLMRKASRLRGLEGVAGQALSQKPKGVNGSKLGAKAPNPGPF